MWPWSVSERSLNGLESFSNGFIENGCLPVAELGDKTSIGDYAIRDRVESVSKYWTVFIRQGIEVAVGRTLAAHTGVLAGALIWVEFWSIQGTCTTLARCWVYLAIGVFTIVNASSAT